MSTMRIAVECGDDFCATCTAVNATPLVYALWSCLNLIAKMDATDPRAAHIAEKMIEPERLLHIANEEEKAAKPAHLEFDDEERTFLTEALAHYRDHFTMAFMHETSQQAREGIKQSMSMLVHLREKISGQPE